MTAQETKISLPPIRLGMGVFITVIALISSFIIGVFWAVADKHNSEVFVTQYEYNKDQKYLSDTVKDIRTAQEEMRADIKQILKEQAKK